MDFLTLSEIVTWPEYLHTLRKRLSLEERKAKFLQNLKDEKEWRQMFEPSRFSHSLVRPSHFLASPPGYLPAEDDIYEEESTDYNYPANEAWNQKVTLFQSLAKYAILRVIVRYHCGKAISLASRSMPLSTQQTKPCLVVAVSMAQFMLLQATRFEVRCLNL